MKNKKQIVFIISILLLTIFYFMYAMTITWDSAHYMSYVNILERVLPFNQWDVVRGPVFPVIIHLGNLIFGKTTQGLLINSYIYYITMLFFSYKILNILLEKNKHMYKIIIFTLITIIFNPIIYGYYHILLTEFVGMTLAVVSCYFAYKWLRCQDDNKKQYIIYGGILILLTILGWFLKQPYVSTALFPLIIAFVIKIFKKEKLKQKIPAVITILVCIISLFISIKSWDRILESKGLDTTGDRNPTNTFGNSLISSLNCFEISYGKTYKIKKETNKFLSEEEIKKIKKQIEDEDYTFLVIDIKNKKGEVIDREYIDTDQFLSTGKSIKFILKNFILHPILVSNSYIKNYFSIIDLYVISSGADASEHIATNKFDITFVNELGSIGMKPYTYTSNIFYITDEAYSRVENYEQFNQAPKLLNYAMIILSKVAIMLFKAIFIILPFCLILSIIKRVTTKNNKYDLLIILFGFSFLHVMLHVVSGAIIDRYAMPAYITTYIGIVAYISLIKKRKVVKIWKKKKH